MGGQIQVLSWEGRASLYCRFYDQANRRYLLRSLKTADLSEATDASIQLWTSLQPRIEAGHPTTEQTIAQAIDLYLQEEQARVDAGVVLPGTVRDKRAQLKVVLLYCGLNSLRTVHQVKDFSFNDFVAWRRDESRRLTEGKDERLKPGSLNKSIRELRAFWKWIRKKRLSTVELEVMEVTSRHEQVRTVNVAFTPEHWEMIEAELLRRTKETRGERRDLIPGQLYGRQHLKTLVQVLIHTGMRPQECTDIIKWRDIQFLNKGKTKQEKLLDNNCVIDLINPRGKGSRKIVSDSGLFLKIFQAYVSRWRKEFGHRPLHKDHLVFGNPMTGQPYAYSGLTKEFRGILADLGLSGLGYTLRSCRGFYISRMLATGASPYLISKNVGHDFDVMKKSYEQLSVSELIEALLE